MSFLPLFFVFTLLFVLGPLAQAEPLPPFPKYEIVAGYHLPFPSTCNEYGDCYTLKMEASDPMSIFRTFSLAGRADNGIILTLGFGDTSERVVKQFMKEHQLPEDAFHKYTKCIWVTHPDHIKTIVGLCLATSCVQDDVMKAIVRFTSVKPWVAIDNLWELTPEEVRHQPSIIEEQENVKAYPRGGYVELLNFDFEE